MVFGRKWKKPDPQKEEKLRNEIQENGGLEKNDLLAMSLGAALVILPAAILVLIILAVIAFLFV